MNKILEMPHKEEYRGYTIWVKQDEIPEDPRSWGNLGTMICFHRRYNLGDDLQMKSGDFPTLKDLYNHLVDDRGAVVILPLFLYDHSGLSMNTVGFSCSWDSGQVGFIYATKQDILSFYSYTNVTGFTKKAKYLTKKLKKAALERLEDEVKVYDQFLKGEVYEYLIYDEDNNLVHNCGGYIGEAKDALRDARAEIDAVVTGPGTQMELNFQEEV